MTLPPIDLPLGRRSLTKDKQAFWSEQLRKTSSERWRTAILRMLAQHYGPEAAQRIEQASQV